MNVSKLDIASQTLNLNTTPIHVAMMMDGNGRWANKNKVSRKDGHIAGSKAFLDVIKRLIEYDIKYISMFAFSTENWNRPGEEVKDLMDLSKDFIQNNLELIDKYNIQLNHLGHLNKLPQDLQEQIIDAIEVTKNNTGTTINIAFDYGGKQDIVDSLKNIIAKKIPIDEINESTVSQHLSTAGMPDPDLIIRPGGEQRLSNFLIWQSAYAEYYYTETLWPDFTADEIDQALIDFANRERRFGKTK
tara:strand:- start:4185 stop:4919 length:735 start_codon:yes stop_codon:yes gene_type:complete